MSVALQIAGYIVALVVGLFGGSLAERRRAKNARAEREEKQRREWREQGGIAIANATEALDLVMADTLESLPREVQLSVLVAAQQRWREPRTELTRLAAVHPAEPVVDSALLMRLAVDQTLDSVGRATALRALPAPGSSEGLREMLEALKAPEAKGPVFASADEQRQAWSRTWEARERAFGAMEDLRRALHDAVESQR